MLILAAVSLGREGRRSDNSTPTIKAERATQQRTSKPQKVEKFQRFNRNAAAAMRGVR